MPHPSRATAETVEAPETTAAAVKSTRRRKSSTKKIAPTPPEPPKCASCGHELTWRDRLYVPAPKKPSDADERWTPPPSRCKVCQQRGARKQRRGFVAFHPATVLVKRGEKTVEVPAPINRAARRRPVAAPVSVPRERKPTRAERRAKARAKAAAATAA